jgi:putative membrane protein insertion efficiency factor
MSLAARALLILVRVYQAFFSALMPSACKFYPSCSHYAAEAVRIHGARRGSWLALRRVSRCHPFTPGGVDLVPDASDFLGDAKSSTGFTGRGKSDFFYHSERSEESLFGLSPRKEGEIPRFARNDKKSGHFFGKLFTLSSFFAHGSGPRQADGSPSLTTRDCPTKEVRS